LGDNEVLDDEEDVVFDDLCGMIDSDEAAINGSGGRKSIFSSLFGSKKASKFEIK